MCERSICADLGRCAYAVASEVHGDGSIPDACPHWGDCFASENRRADREEPSS